MQHTFSFKGLLCVLLSLHVCTYVPTLHTVPRNLMLTRVCQLQEDSQGPVHWEGGHTY